eukprot:6149630-Prymnesium_polylepis.2
MGTCWGNPPAARRVRVRHNVDTYRESGLNFQTGSPHLPVIENGRRRRCCSSVPTIHLVQQRLLGRSGWTALQ